MFCVVESRSLWREEEGKGGVGIGGGGGRRGQRVKDA